MTRYESIMKAIRHEPCEYVPYSIPLTVEAYAAYGERLMKDYPNEQAQEDYAKKTITIEQAVGLSIGNHLVYVYGPWWSWYNVADEYFHAEDTPEYLPDTIGTGNYQSFFDQCDHIRSHYDVYPLLTIWGSHWEKVYGCRGIENFLYDIGAEPELAQKMLDFIIHKNIVMLENLLPAGNFDGVLLGSDWGTQRGLIMSPKTWRKMIRGGEEREYELLKKYNKHVWIHSCGCITDIMPDLCDMGVQVLNPIQPECMDIRMLKEKFGNNICYYGGISTQRTLPYGTPSEVIKETERTIEIMRGNGGYITAPSQEIQIDVPYENLRALIDTARAYSVENNRAGAL